MIRLRLHHDFCVLTSSIRTNVKMTSAKDSFAELERYRLQLEDSVAKLGRSLRHWQTWEVEYEGMKEEIHRLGENHTHEDLVRISS